jgi:hypothetical protein
VVEVLGTFSTELPADVPSGLFDVVEEGLDVPRNPTAPPGGGGSEPWSGRCGRRARPARGTAHRGGQAPGAVVVVVDPVVVEPGTVVVVVGGAVGSGTGLGDRMTAESGGMPGAVTGWAAR